MPIYTLQGPDGKRYRIEGPEGATPEQLAAVIQGQGATRTTPEPTRIDPTEGMSGGQKFLAGVGKAFVDTGRGVAQLFGLGDAQEIADARKRDEALMNTGAGLAGNVVGNLAAYAPLAMVPGANTVAGGAALGALTGAAQPTVEGESRLANAVVGGIAGGAVPAAVRAGKTIKAAAIDPFTEAGRTRIAGGVLNRTAADPQAAAQRMAAASGATPGFAPTAGQAADDAGIAALERTTRAINPQGFDAVDKSQRAALADAVRGIAKDDAARTAAIEARRTAAQQLYDAALDPANQQPVTPWLKGQVTQLTKRPSINAASKDAQRWAMERGEKPSPMGSLRALHDVKQSLDDMIGKATIEGRGGEVAALRNTQEQLLTTMEKLSPQYQQARQTYAQMSRPINQMDIGQEFAKRLMPAISRDMDAPMQLNAASFARALTDQGDDIARKATGMPGARLDSIMEPDQLQALRGVAADLQMVKAAESAGRGVGSDTVQKTAMSHLAAEAGIPTWMASVARVPGGWIKNVGSALYGNSDKAVQQMLAEMLANPKEAAKAMQAAGLSPSMTAQLLERGAQGAALTSIPMALNR